MMKPPSNPRRHPEKAFTLVELLTVMAIIGLLAALLFPSFTRAREEARKASCRENLRHIGQGCIQFAQDYKDRYPSVLLEGSTVSNPMASLAMLFDKYVGSKDAFTCPSTLDRCTDLVAGETLAPHGIGQPPQGSKRKECSYAYDDTKDNTTPPDVAIAADALPAPGEEVVSVSIGIGGGTQSYKISANHRGTGQNVLYYDGHVKWSKSPFASQEPDDNIYEPKDPNSITNVDSYCRQ